MLKNVPKGTRSAFDVCVADLINDLIMEPDKGLERYRNDPVGFVREVLNEDPWEKQEEVLEAVRDNRRVTVRSCHGVGKTKCASWVALWFLLTHPDSCVISTAPTWQQVEQLLWREIRNSHAKSKIPLPGQPLTTKYEINDKWFALGLSTDKPERFQGFHSSSGDILLICDEASGIDQAIYDAAEGFLASAGARILLIGNPTQMSGEFYSSFKTSIYHKIHISAFDSPNLTHGQVVRKYLITKEWVDEKRVKWTEESPLWSSRVLGDFPEQSEDTLIPLAWIEAAIARYPSTERSTNAPFLGCDIARFGSDSTVIWSVWGNRAELYAQIRKQDTMEVAGAITNAIKETSAAYANVDVCGLGAGVYDRLKEMNQPAIDLNAAGKPVDTERFVNNRAEWYWNLRERFQSGDIAIPDNEELAAQLTGLKYKFDSRGRYLIESKEEMKKRGMSSPDLADALMLAFAQQRPPQEIGAMLV